MFVLVTLDLLEMGTHVRVSLHRSLVQQPEWACCQPRFRNATTGFLKHEVWETNVEIMILITSHWPDPGIALLIWRSATGVCCLQTIRSTTQIWVVNCHQYEISACSPPVIIGCFLRLEWAQSYQKNNNLISVIGDNTNTVCFWNFLF